MNIISNSSSESLLSFSKDEILLICTALLSSSYEWRFKCEFDISDRASDLYY